MNRMQMFPAAYVPGVLLVILASIITLLFQARPLITESSLASLAPWMATNTPLAAGVLFLGVLPTLCSTTVFALAAVVFMAHEEKPLMVEAPAAPAPVTEAIRIEAPTIQAPVAAMQGLMALSNAIGSSTVKPEPANLAGSPLEVSPRALAQEDLHQVQQDR
jgi:hypothetical protein